MKKILHLTHTDARSDSRILKEMQTFVSNGYRVSAVGVLLNEGSRSSESPLEEHIKTLIIYSRGLRMLPRMLRHIFSLIELSIRIIFSTVKCKPNVIHCHDIVVLPVGVFLKAITGAKLVYDAHELESDRNGLGKLEGFFVRLVEKCLWRWVDGLIVVSFSIDEWYQKNIGLKPSAVIFNSPIISKSEIIDKFYLRKKFEITKGQKIFVYSGLFENGRGIDAITQIFTQPSMLSHIVFLGYGTRAPELKELAANNENIHVHDAVPHSMVVPIIQSADFGLCLIENVSLSDYYCLPNKLFEYLFAGVPVVASKFPEIERIVSYHGVGICANPDINSLREAITKISKKSHNFKFFKIEKLGWAENEKVLIRFYKKLFT